MRFVLYTTALSAHQLPVYRLIREKLGAENCRYICEKRDGESVQTRLGEVGVDWKTKDEPGAQDWLENSEIMYVGGVRPLGLFERRAAKGLKTLYQSERWFKPISTGVGTRCRCSLPGSLRMLVPSYRKMVKRFVKWANADPGARVLAIGPWAKRDFLKMGVRADKIVDWGYFVEPSVSRVERVERVEKTLRVLWAGRDIPLKHVSDIERAVALANKSLKKKLNNPPLNTYHSSFITFTKLTGVSPSEVRAAMRTHDTFVFASNSYEGWGAVVSEALEEGMNVIGTFEAGASAAILPKERLYHAGDVGALVNLLKKEYNNELPQCSIGEWTVECAAKRLLSL